MLSYSAARHRQSDSHHLSEDYTADILGVKGLSTAEVADTICERLG